ncbi:MAG: hypothetical protein Q8K23_11215 [Sulfuritalea sp.]|jgi:hypothetical protein|nr:hypothetical protein [Sulfuritalea sp.]
MKLKNASDPQISQIDADESGCCPQCALQAPTTSMPSLRNLRNLRHLRIELRYIG